MLQTQVIGQLDNVHLEFVWSQRSVIRNKLNVWSWWWSSADADCKSMIAGLLDLGRFSLLIYNTPQSDNELCTIARWLGILFCALIKSGCWTGGGESGGRSAGREADSVVCGLLSSSSFDDDQAESGESGESGYATDHEFRLLIRTRS